MEKKRQSKSCERIENIETMQKRIKAYFFIGISIFLLFLCGCQMKQLEKEEREALNFTVLDVEQIPLELSEIIKNNCENEIKMTYIDQGYLYLVRGYGKQKTGGYSISVNEVYRNKNGIYVDTSLIGPKPGIKYSEDPSFPYIVLRMKERKEDVFFEVSSLDSQMIVI